MFDLLNEPVEIRLSRAKNKKSDQNTLDILSHDSFWFVRNFVAGNPSTSYETLCYLLQDDDFRVQFEAEKNIRKRGLSNRIKDIESQKDKINSLTFRNINRDKEEKHNR